MDHTTSTHAQPRKNTALHILATNDQCHSKLRVVTMHQEVGLRVEAVLQLPTPHAPVLAGSVRLAYGEDGPEHLPGLEQGIALRRLQAVPVGGGQLVRLELHFLVSLQEPAA